MIHTLSEALAERGYDTLTPVQEAVADPELQEADLLVSAQTGSGKTVGFGLAIAPTLLDETGVFGPAEAPQALVVAPTRELAFQVSRELGWLYAKAGARVATCVGGMDMRDERRALERGAHVVVGTPGRLRDHIQRGSLDMTALRAVVLDEADEMLDLGFREDLEFMLGEAPEDRRTLLFSATVPPMIVTLAQKYQREAVRVTTLSDKEPHADIAYQALQVAQHDVENAVINVLRFHEAQNAIVFANTRATVNRLTARFANRGFQVVCLSGELSQAERSHALQAMRDGRARVCVATDVAARGIDLPNLELVIHAELPSSAESLLHRSGRTGRAGRKGISALIVPPKSAKKAERLLRTARISADWTTAPGAEEILRRDEERLLADPTWDETPSETEAAFAERLLAAQTPQSVAAAYLRLYRTRHSAPEDLSSPDARPAPKERAPFGPSAWFALSVGRDDRAEARWLLPLLLRAGGLDKEAIGAIRVQQSETFVEIAEAGAARFEAALGAGGELEKGVSARRLDEAPDLGRPTGGRETAKPRSSGPKPRRERDAGDHSAPAASAPPREAKQPPAPRPAPEKAAAPRPAPEKAKAPSEAQGEAAAQTARKPSPPPAKKAAGKDSEQPRKGPGKPKPQGGSDKRTGSGKPKHKAEAVSDFAAKPRKPKAGADTDKRTGPGKPRGDGPGKRPGAGGSKPGAGKPGGGARRTAEPAARSSASDTSKRFTPPGKPAKPGRARGAEQKRAKGGMHPPKRGKS